jgi:Fe-S oxidoreductase
MTANILEILKQTGALACLDCGKCTSICPVSRHSPYSPRLAVTLLTGGESTVDPGLWDCLTCDRCNLECPSDVHFGEMVGKVRRQAYLQNRFDIPCAHGGALQSMMRLAASEKTEPDRRDWIPDDARIAEEGEVLYFVGCLPQFDTFFDNLDLDLTGTARAALRLLNALDVEPVVLPDERCCGHDLLWAGDEEAFLQLTQRNLEAIRRTGAKTVVFSCAECYHTFRFPVNDRFGPLDFHAIHLTEFLSSRLEDLPLKSRPGSLTFHDPCRLGRFADVFKSPRLLMDAIPDVERREMPRSREQAACCGTSLWAACGAVSRSLQKERLEEAAATGADAMVTACPKCRVHFACSRSGPATHTMPDIPVRDIAEVLAEALGD